MNNFAIVVVSVDEHHLGNVLNSHIVPSIGESIIVGNVSGKVMDVIIDYNDLVVKVVLGLYVKG